MDSDGTCGFSDTGELAGAYPLLGPLQDNGGPSQTHALLQGSPAIDAGNPATPGSGGSACEAIDQRGVSRPQGAACDIGAFELDPGTPIPGVSSMGMITLAGLLGAAGFWRLRRRFPRRPV